jgi:ATP-dependent DNA ligase
MSGIIKRSASQAVEVSPSRRSQPNSPLPKFVPPQLSKPVAAPPSGPQWLHEIKLDGFRMAARIDNGRVQLLTRTGLDWTGKYPGVPAQNYRFKRFSQFRSPAPCWRNVGRIYPLHADN